MNKKDKIQELEERVNTLERKAGIKNTRIKSVLGSFFKIEKLSSVFESVSIPDMTGITGRVFDKIMVELPQSEKLLNKTGILEYLKKHQVKIPDIAAMIVPPASGIKGLGNMPKVRIDVRDSIIFEKLDLDTILERQSKMLEGMLQNQQEAIHAEVNRHWAKREAKRGKGKNF